MWRFLSSLVLVLSGLSVGSCADPTTNMNVTLLFPSVDSPVIDVLYDRDPDTGQVIGVRAGTTVRVLYQYQDLVTPTESAVIVDPRQAEPTISAVRLLNGQTVIVTNWHKASAPGNSPQGASIESFVSLDIPLNRRALWVAVEFIQEFQDGFFVVAYGCTGSELAQPVSEEDFRTILSRGIEIYAGRTCGECIPTIGEQQFDPSGNTPNNPAFTLENLSQNAPRECGGYDS